MLKQDHNLLHKNALFNLRKFKKEESKFVRMKRICFLIGVIFSLIIIITIYFISSRSNIYRIVVKGNNYLKDEDIIKLSELSSDEKYLLTFPLLVENRIKTNPLINNCVVSRLDNRLIEINVEEKKAICYKDNNGKNQLILSNDERIDLDNSNNYLINYVPYIDGFDDEQIKLIEKNLEECDYKIINEISEIHNYPDLKYQNVELIMRDGNYIFTSVYGLNILNHYHKIQSSYISNNKICYYFEDISGNAYSSACPWEAVEEENEENIEETDEDYDEENDG